MQNVFTRNVPPYFLGGKKQIVFVNEAIKTISNVFFYKKTPHAKRCKKYKKHQTQANNFHPLKKDFARAKSCFLCYFFSLIFVLLVCFFCLRVFLCTYISFVSLLVCACKFFCIFSLKKIIKRYGLDGLIYQYY